MQELEKLVLCLALPGAFCLLLAVSDVVFQLLYGHSRTVRRWVGKWEPEDEDWEDEE